ncbi:MAG TPA: DoxX family protein [Sandaracinaceae bacterium]
MRALPVPAWAPDLGLLVLRLSIGSMMLFGHGLPKLLDFSEKAATFADPLGVGSTTSLVLAIFGEVVASAFVIVGLGTRLAAVPFLITMLVAAFVVHAGDPWSRKELAVLFAVGALTLFFTGPGRFALDALFARKRERSAPAVDRAA